MTEVRTERVKLFAGYLNIIAAASMVASLVTEPFTWSMTGRTDSYAQLKFVAISFVLSIACHLIAQIALGRLDR